MTLVEFAASLFSICNSLRLLAYIPQVLCLVRAQDGARSVSCISWASFAFSHLSTVAYALIVVNDWQMAAMFAANTVACVTIIAITGCKRANLNASGLLPIARSSVI
jgi:uncharacterized protein with PQ loop repeat